MKVIVQRSLNSSVSVSGQKISEIEKGLVLLVGFDKNDTVDDVNYMVKKISNLRIFNDDNGIMNYSLLQVGGEVLSISQFTLSAATKRGNRPSYIHAMKNELAKKLYDYFNEELKKMGIIVKIGQFGADMQVSILNDGPVTIILESR